MKTNTGSQTAGVDKRTIKDLGKLTTEKLVEMVNDDINDGTPYELETLMYGVKWGKS